MELGSQLRVRLQHHHEQLIHAEVAASNSTVQAVLREKIERAFDIEAELAGMRGEIEDGFYEVKARVDDLPERVAKGVGRDQGIPESVTYELLALMRLMAGTENLALIRRDMKRLGLTPYNLEKANK